MIIEMPFIRPVKLILFFLVTAVLVACGGGGSSSDSKSSVEETKPPVEETKPPVEETKPPVEETKPPATEPEPEPEPTVDCSDIHPYEKYIAIGDSITAGVGDDIAVDNITADGCYESRGFPPVLNDRLNEKKGRRYFINNKGVPGDKSLDGTKFVGSLLDREAIHYLVMYGTNDSDNAVDGLGVEPSQFRENMQNIIDQIHAAGKKAYLAKIPPILGEENRGERYQDLDQGPRNQLIQQYNKVIDELVRKNGIDVTPPDFYKYFKSRTHFYADNVHLNGAGYQRMADLWWHQL